VTITGSVEISDDLNPFALMAGTSSSPLWLQEEEEDDDDEDWDDEDWDDDEDDEDWEEDDDDEG
jgi:hypothetical protein